ncbi:MAG TPA: phosphate/phosphite/phosphonate ABC transporter substrate-binding protein [Jiangellaceae bacterium]|nr:phosphate/phosphite/phosphonate ABC transporter substrate-binding protein [Jiangellaceae bacterium]
MRTRAWASAAAASCLLLAGCGGGSDGGGSDDGGPEGSGPEGWPDRVILGLVPSHEVDQLVEDAEVLGDLLAAEVGVPVETFVPTDYAALVIAMETGRAHVGMFGPIALVQAADRAGAVITLQSVRRGAASYHTQWITNNPDRFCDTPVVEAENPEGNVFTYCNGTDTATEGPVGEEALTRITSGETVIFVDPSSASGYYYPATQLQTVTGIDPITGVDAQFAGDHPGAILAVHRGDAEVGVSFDDARNVVVGEVADIGKVVVFAWSPEIPNDGVAIAGDLPEDLREAITRAFLDIIETPEGAKAFEAVYSIEGLVPADLEAIDVARKVEANFGE